MKLLLTTACIHLAAWALPAPAQIVVEEVSFTGSDTRGGDHFGCAVSLSGDTALIGAFEDFHDDIRSGSAYVFVRLGTVWDEQAKLTVGDAEADDRLGQAVAIWGDTAVVAAPLDDDACPPDPNCDSGSVYVFVRQGVVWTPQAKLTASDAVIGAHFGAAVSIHGDTIVVGASNHSFGPAGAAYVFVREGTTWSQQAKLTGSSASGFAASVSIDQDTIVVSEWEPDGTAARVFTRSGSAWSLQGIFTVGPGFRGGAVSIHGDTAVAGDWLPGKAYSFEHSGTTWAPGLALIAGPGAVDHFGRAVAVHGDVIAVGATCSWNSSCPGAAYVFFRAGSDWDLGTELVASDGAGGDLFGSATDVEGSTVLIGVPNDDHVNGVDAGSVYVFAVDDLAPGTVSCLGVGCPCGNDDPGAGCANSTGLGGLLSGAGSPSVGNDDLVLQASQLPPNNQGLVYMAEGTVTNPFFDGIQCALGAATFRFLGSAQNTGPAGTLTFGPGIAVASLGRITAGSTWHFHAWHRDLPGSPCGTGANLTNMYSVTFAP